MSSEWDVYEKPRNAGILRTIWEIVKLGFALLGGILFLDMLFGGDDE